MFGYVTPCKMELKIKDFERFKAYYCGVCKSIKNSFGNLPRFALNYDMTFLALLLDSLSNTKSQFSKERCWVHPIKKRIILVHNDALNYAAFCNVALMYYKLLDNVADDHSLNSKIYASVLKGYFKKFPSSFSSVTSTIEENLAKLYKLEKQSEGLSLDEIAHPFAELTGFILSEYVNVNKIEPLSNTKDNLYWLGYNLGKWIYLIDAWDDLEKDVQRKKFNAIHSVLNKTSLSFENFACSIKERIDFTLTSCGQQCVFYLDKLPLIKNKEILYNILQFGLMEKMDNVFKRSECKNEKPL